MWIVYLVVGGVVLILAALSIVSLGELKSDDA